MDVAQRDTQVVRNGPIAYAVESVFDDFAPEGRRIDEYPLQQCVTLR